MEEAALPAYFGEWLKYRRKELDLTQSELAQRVGCSIAALRKIEGGDRRPSKQLAALLARSLEVPEEDQINFIRAARGETHLETLPPLTRVPAEVYRSAPRVEQPPGNLPGMLAAFIGREPELATMGQLLRDPQCRLLTLTGPGGIGKTRLGIEVACRHKDHFPDGVWFVPLAPLSSPEFLVAAIADALSFRFQDPAKPYKQLLDYLQNKKALLVLDNAEHLLSGVGLFAEILESSPDIKLLVTSRERLNLLSEWVFDIHGLPVPPSEKTEHFEEYSSVALFMQSARRTRNSFNLQGDEQRWVIRICQIMEGMPLGIELAAAWVGLLSCEEIVAEIERNLDFLSVSMRDLPERHRSLRATLDYSWNLLNAEEKTILSRLSVFQGSFRREAAEVICGANLAILSSLKDKSLLRRTEQGRYDLHELIHQYAALRLAENDCEAERLKDEHAVYFARRLAEWEKALKSARQTETLAEMALEIDNLRQAWQRLVACSVSEEHIDTLRNPALFHSSLFSMSLFYEMRCRNWEAISLFAQSVEDLKNASEAFVSPEDRWFLILVLGHITAYLGLHHGYTLQYQKAQQILEEALDLLTSAQASLEKAQAQVMLAWIFLTQGQVPKAVTLLEQSLIMFREEGDIWWYTLALAHLAWAYLSSGKIAEGKSLYLEGLRLADPGDLRLTVQLQNGLAYASYLENDYAEAERLLQENLELSFELGFKRQTALSYIDMAQVALATNRLDLAEQYFQESVDLLSEFGESHDLAMALIYLGKSLVTRQEIRQARSKFSQAIQIGRGLNIFYLVYWGLVYLAWVEYIDGQSDKAFKMALVLRRYSVESKVVQHDYLPVLEDLIAKIAPEEVAGLVSSIEGWGVETLLRN